MEPGWCDNCGIPLPDRFRYGLCDNCGWHREECMSGETRERSRSRSPPPSPPSCAATPPEPGLQAANSIPEPRLSAAPRLVPLGEGRPSSPTLVPGHVHGRLALTEYPANPTWVSVLGLLVMHIENVKRQLDPYVQSAAILSEGLFGVRARLTSLQFTVSTAQSLEQLNTMLLDFTWDTAIGSGARSSPGQ